MDCQKQRERSRRDSQQWSVLRGNQTFKTVVEKEKRAGTQFDVTSRGRTSNADKRAGLIRSPWPCDERRVRRTKTVSAYQNSHGPGDTLSCSENVAQNFGTRPKRGWCRWRAGARVADEPHLREQQPETDEAVSRVEFDSAKLEREEDRTLSTSSLNAFDDGSESSTATLCFTKAFSEQLAFVKVLRHNVMMLHSDQEPVLVQLSKTVQNRRFERTSVRHGPRTSHRSQSKSDNHT